MIIGTLIHNFLFCKKVGEDEFGNKYYISKVCDADGKYRRSVIYKGLHEPSKVPPMWHAWLHYITDDIPKIKKYKWQKKYVPNLTGTKRAYMPPGLPASGEDKRHKISGDYEAWKPN